MGYTTDFFGTFTLNKKLDQETHSFLVKLNETRRMRRTLPPKYGIEGEFYVDGAGFMGQDRDLTVLDYNTPPKTQPSLWCQWRPTDDGLEIEWDGNEKFYEYVEWLKYIVRSILAPKGYVINGRVGFRGEDFEDTGFILAEDNSISVKAR